MYTLHVQIMCFHIIKSVTCEGKGKLQKIRLDVQKDWKVSEILHNLPILHILHILKFFIFCLFSSKRFLATEKISAESIFAILRKYSSNLSSQKHLAGNAVFVKPD